MRESNNEKTSYDNIDCSDCMQHYIYKSITNSINADYQNSKEYGVVIKCKKDNFDFTECMTWPQDYKDENAKLTKKAG